MTMRNAAPPVLHWNLPHDGGIAPAIKDSATTRADNRQAGAGGGCPPAVRDGAAMSETRSMTYAELAAALGIGADSARNLVRRKRWHRFPGNDGMARIAVPVEHLEQGRKPAWRSDEGAADAPADPPIAATPDAAGLALTILTDHVRRCEAEIRELKEELETARERAADRDVIAAQLTALGVALGEMRNERRMWREHAERLLAATHEARRPWWSWLTQRPAPPADPASAEPKPRTAREAARDAGLSLAVPPQESALPETTVASLLDGDGPGPSPADLERAIATLASEAEALQDKAA